MAVRGAAAHQLLSPKIILCAGHGLGGGASASGLTENPYNYVVAALAARELWCRGVRAIVAPLTRLVYPAELLTKIAWVAERARPGDLAVDIHLDINPPGCAAFVVDDAESLVRGETIARAISRETGLGCRGGRPEHEAAAGRLGFLHGVDCHAVVVELLSMNTADAAFAHRPDAQPKLALGLARGCADALGAAAA